MSRPLLLDLFCGAGGAGMGYHLAGFDVVGVDMKPQPRYPFDFVEMDALDALLNLEGFTADAHGFAAIHASPPCQHFSALNVGMRMNSKTHPDLIEPTRDLLRLTGVPYVIENVPGSPLLNPMRLCGSMFDLRIEEGYLQRHRLFESSVELTAPGPCRHEGQAIGVYGHGRGGGDLRGRSANADQARRLMEMPWSHRDGCSQAIPPAYTKHIGKQLLEAIR